MWRRRPRGVRQYELVQQNSQQNAVGRPPRAPSGSLIQASDGDLRHFQVVDGMHTSIDIA